MMEEREAEEEFTEEKKDRRKSKNTIVDPETGIISGQREIRKIGNSFYLNVPQEFMDQHNLKEGDRLSFGANHILKYMPIQEK